jgi:endonuclease YncB( thermonuclease family)
VVSVHDGDTVTVLTTAKESLKVRLYGIDAPEQTGVRRAGEAAYFASIMIPPTNPVERIVLPTLSI